MIDPFADRVGEAAIVLSDEERNTLRTGVGSIAQGNVSRSGLLELVRLAFGRSPDPAVVAQFTDRLDRVGIATRPRDEHKIAILAAITLIERFARPMGKRTTKTLLNDSVAAAAVRVLHDQDEMPVHPDLLSYADYWHALASDHLRGGPALTSPPQLPQELAVLVARESEEDAATLDTIAADVLPRYVALLGNWLGRPGWAARVQAIEEQQSYAWWLMSERADTSSERFIVAMCEEVLSLCRFLPGPPAADQLLQRRLPDPERIVDVNEVARLAKRDVSADIRDLCAFVNETAPTFAHTASDVASALYNELLLVAMVNNGAAT